jgi:hypothetical protein
VLVEHLSNCHVLSLLIVGDVLHAPARTPARPHNGGARALDVAFDLDYDHASVPAESDDVGTTSVRERPLSGDQKHRFAEKFIWAFPD